MQKLSEILVIFQGVFVFDGDLLTEKYQEEETGLESCDPNLNV